MSMPIEAMSNEDDAGEPVSGQEPALPTALPAAPVQPPSDAEGSQELVYPAYRAVVTAHFPDRESGTQAQERLMSLASYNLVVQWFDGQAQDIPEALREEVVEATALLIHLQDEQHGEEVIRVCEEAGATKTKYYPARSVAGEAGQPANLNRSRSKDV